MREISNCKSNKNGVGGWRFYFD